MADVGVNASSLSAPQGAGTQVVSPVEKRLDLGFISDAVSIFKSLNKDDENAPLAAYNQEVDRINQGLETGAINAKEAMGKWRTVHSRYSAQYPALTESFTKSAKGFKEFTGVGEADRQIIEEDQRVKQLVQGAAAAGWYISPGATQEQKEAVIKNFAQETDNQKKLEAYYKKTEFDRKSVTFDQDQNDREFTITTTQIMATSSGPAFEALSSTASMLAKEVQANPQMLGEAQARLSRVFAQKEAELQALAGRIPQNAAPYRSLLAGMKEPMMALLDPSKQSESERKKVEDDLATLKAKLQFAVLSPNPSVQSAYATTALMGPNVWSQLGSANAARDIAVQLGASDPSKPTATGAALPRAADLSPKDFKAFNKSVSEILKDPRLGKDEKFTTQANNLTKNYLEELSKLPEDSTTTAKMAAALELVSTPAFGTFSQQGNLTPEQRQGLKRVFNSSINQPMTKDLRGKMEMAVPEGMFYDNSIGAKNFSDLIGDIKFAGAGIEFVPRKGYRLAPMRQDQFDRESKDIAAAVSLAVRAGAHLEGHTDYQKSWEELRTQLMPTLYKAPVPPKIGQTVKAGEDTYEYIGGPDGRESSWRKLTKPKQ